MIQHMLQVGAKGNHEEDNNRFVYACYREVKKHSRKERGDQEKEKKVGGPETGRKLQLF